MTDNHHLTRHAWAVVFGTLVLAIVCLGVLMYASERFDAWFWR